MSDHEKRRHPRIDVRQAVWVEGQNVRGAGEALNVSREGMFVVSDAVPAVGSTLEVRLEDPQEGPIQLTMQVAWTDPGTLHSKMGLRALDSRDLATFARVVARYEAGQPTPPPPPPEAPEPKE